MLPKNSTKKVIVLSGDYSYINQITTTIKSVLYHDRGIKFYLINSDIPQEWFRLINQHLAPLASVIIDKKNPAISNCARTRWPGAHPPNCLWQDYDSRPNPRQWPGPLLG